MNCGVPPRRPFYHRWFTLLTMPELPHRPLALQTHCAELKPPDIARRPTVLTVTARSRRETWKQTKKTGSANLRAGQSSPFLLLLFCQPLIPIVPSGVSILNADGLLLPANNLKVPFVSLIVIRLKESLDELL